MPHSPGFYGVHHSRTVLGPSFRVAAVTFNGVTKHTGSAGRVSFTIPKTAKLGKHAVSATLSGYTRATATVTV